MQVAGEGDKARGRGSPMERYRELLAAAVTDVNKKYSCSPWLQEAGAQN